MTNITIGQHFKSTQDNNYTYKVTRLAKSRVTLTLQNNNLQHEVEIDMKDMPSHFTPIVQPIQA